MKPVYLIFTKPIKFIILLWCSTSIICFASENQPGTHCLKGEVIYFSCKAGKEKILSLCGTETGDGNSSLKYIFGALEKPELTYSALADENYGSFKFNHYLRYGTDYFRVSFIRNDYRYEIYRDYDSEETSKEVAGIMVESLATGAVKSNIACLRNIKANFHPLSSTLPCNEESALGCTR